MLGRRVQHRWRVSAYAAGGSVASAAAAVCLATRRGVFNAPEAESRDGKRFKQGADPNTGQQMNMVEVPDTTNFQLFNNDALEHVEVPGLTLDQRENSDQDKEAEMVKKYGRDGPGERLSKTMAQESRDALQKQQDIDGLPWEVRWKRNLIPTHEEMIAEVRDRFELFEVDPIEREKSWYLHWRDRLYNAQRDRLIWPEGYTDYLDHYDENGVRRTLPTDQRWSDVSWKHLADTNYRDRMWMIESEERKALDHMMEDEPALLEEAKGSQDEVAEMFMGIQYGVIDIDPDQAAQALSGTADPMEVAKTKYKINEYAAEQAWTLGKNAKEFDPVTGLPKSEREPLPTGVTVEQATAVQMRADMMDEKMQQEGESAAQQGQGASQYTRSQLETSRKAKIDRPAIRTMTEGSVKQLQQANLEIEEIKRRKAEELAASGGDPAAALEAPAAAGAPTDGMTPSERTQAAFDRVATDLQAKVSRGDIEGSKPGSMAPTEALAAVEKAAAEAEDDGLSPKPTMTATGPVGASSSSDAPDVSSGAPRRRIVAEVVMDDTMSDEAKEAVRMAKEASRQQKSGFIDVPKRPEGAEPTTHPDILHQQVDEVTETVPDWYTEQAVKPGPMVGTYGLTDDPIEKKPLRPEFLHERPPIDEKNRVVDDQATMGENAFDEGRIFLEKNSPELARGVYKGLPTYRDHVEADAAEAEAEPEDDTRSKSEKLRDERKQRMQKAKQSFDPDLALPDLPWETDPTRDPYRGVSDVMEVTFDRKKVEAVFRVYKEFLQQRLVELANMNGSTSDDRVEQFIREAVERIRAGHVGDHPEVDPMIVDIFKLVYEGHLKQFLSDYYNFRGGRKADVDSLKSESQDLLRRATAKSKQLGQGFVDLMQEMTAVELDQVKKNPVQKYCILCREKAHEVIAKPFIRWIQEELTEFGKGDFKDWEQIEQARNHAMKTLNEAKYKSPRRLEGVKDGARDYVVESFYHWGRGALVYHTGRHYWQFYLKFADSRFRYRAQEFFEESWEVFIAYHKCSREVGVHIPVPFSEPMFELQETEFYEGENGVIAEASGDFEKAEKIWNSGTALRWYPQYDETDYMLFNERRGKISQAYDVSDRTLESMQKKTHPSIHPFPERAKKWLENAPLTQETAEHLWMRYMGDMYCEHADFCQRMGKSKTSREHLDKGVNFYRVALRESQERLPKTWHAPLLTHVKLLARSVDASTDPDVYTKEVVKTIDKIYKLDTLGPRHWEDRFHEVHWRVSLLFYSVPVFAKIVLDAVSAKARAPSTQLEMVEIVQKRAQIGFTGFDPLERAANEVAEGIWRKHILRWRDQEKDGTDEWHTLNTLYFTFKVCPASPDDVDRYWAQLKPTYEHAYMRTALGSRGATRLFSDVVRRMCQVLLPGTRAHKEELLAELEKIQEKLHFALVAAELKRTVSALELHLKDSSKPPYVFGSMQLAANATRGAGSMQNPLLSDDRSAEEYRQLNMRMAAAKSGSGKIAQESNIDNPLDRAPKTGKDHFVDAAEGASS